MKKFFIFAIALVAGALAFTNCNGKNNPDDPTDVNPADYPNTVWRIDSAFMDGEKSRPPHGIFRILDDKLFTFNGDTLNYAFKDGKLVIQEQDELTIAGVKKGWAHLSESIARNRLERPNYGTQSLRFRGHMETCVLYHG